MVGFERYERKGKKMQRFKNLRFFKLSAVLAFVEDPVGYKIEFIE